MLLVCEWPFFQYVFSGINPDYDAIAKTCHAFRNYKDSMDSWASIDEIIQYYGQYNDLFIKHSGIHTNYLWLMFVLKSNL